MAKIKDIAKLAEVSITTVSRVLNQDKTFHVADETRQKILKVAEELNYVSPHYQKRKKSVQYNIGLINWYTSQDELNDPYYFSLRNSIEKEAEKQNLFLKKLDLTHFSVQQVKTYDGIIILGKFSDDFIADVYQLNPHLVVVDYYTDLFNIDVVVSNLMQATRDIIHHYTKTSQETIGFISGIEETYDKVPISDVRLLTYQNEMYRLEMFNEAHIYLGRFSADSGYEMMRKIIKKNQLLKRYIVGSDSLAVGCLKALNEAQIKVPDDVSIISYDDTPLSQFTIPSLSTVHIYTKEMGASAVTLLVEKIETKREIGKKIMIPTKLMIRDSNKKFSTE